MRASTEATTGRGRPKATTDYDVIALRRACAAARPVPETLRALIERVGSRPAAPVDLLDEARARLAGLDCGPTPDVDEAGAYVCSTHGPAGSPGCRLQAAE